MGIWERTRNFCQHICSCSELILREERNAERVFVGANRSDVEEVEHEGSMGEKVFVRERVLRRLKKCSQTVSTSFRSRDAKAKKENRKSPCMPSLQKGYKFVCIFCQ